MNVRDAVFARRSVPSFDSTVTISESEILDLLNAANLAPSSMNLQPWEYVVCHSPESKVNLQQVSYGQKKISEASAVVIVLGNLMHHENASQIAAGNIAIGITDEEKAAKFVQSAASAYEQNSQRQRDEAFRGGSLWAMNFMLIAKDAGWETAPMGGFIPEDVQKAFELPDHLLPVLLICIGKANPEVIIHARGTRISAEKKVRFQ
jgi:putative NAD(P)H nitroreductase